MIVARWASLVVALVLLTAVVMRGRVDGLFILAVVLLMFFAWTLGAFRIEFWNGKGSLMDTQEKRAVTVVSPEVAADVLWFFGDERNGTQPGGFVSNLLRTMGSADRENRATLVEAFPEYGRAFELAALEPWGLGVLLSIVRDAQDAREAFLPMFDQGSAC